MLLPSEEAGVSKSGGVLEGELAVRVDGELVGVGAGERIGERVAVEVGRSDRADDGGVLGDAEEAVAGDGGGGEIDLGVDIGDCDRVDVRCTRTASPGRS